MLDNSSVDRVALSKYAPPMRIIPMSEFQLVWNRLGTVKLWVVIQEPFVKVVQ